MIQKTTSPTKIFGHNDNRVDREFANIYEFLGRLDTGPFSFAYDATNKKLYISLLNANTQQYDSVVEINASTKNIRIAGTLTQSATLDNYARG